jgi:hypothetical protein
VACECCWKNHEIGLENELCKLVVVWRGRRENERVLASDFSEMKWSDKFACT